MAHEVSELHFKRPVLIFIAAKSYTWLISVIIALIFMDTDPASGFVSHLRNSLAAWDSWIYESISRTGYNELFKCAFFPLMPMITGSISKVFSSDVFWTGVLLANIFTLFAVVIMYNLIREEYSEDAAFLSCLFLLTAPTAYVYNSYLTEPLFLLLSTAFFYSLKKGRFFAAALICGLATATRNVGVFLIPVFIYEYYKNVLTGSRRERFMALAGGTGLKIAGYCLVMSAGLIAYMIYLQAVMHDHFAFVKATRLWPEREMANFPFESFIRRIGQFGREFRLNVAVEKLNLEFLYFGALTMLIIYGIRKIRISHAIYLLQVYALLAMQSRLTSEERYISSIFVVWVLLSLFIAGRRHSKVWVYSLTGIFLVWQFYISARLAMRYWVG